MEYVVKLSPNSGNSKLPYYLQIINEDSSISLTDDINLAKRFKRALDAQAASDYVAQEYSVGYWCSYCPAD